MEIVNRPDRDFGNYDEYDFAMQLAVLRHILSYSQGMEWSRLKTVILDAIRKLV